jgi:hypothetical protein
MPSAGTGILSTVFQIFYIQTTQESEPNKLAMNLGDLKENLNISPKKKRTN